MSDSLEPVEVNARFDDQGQARPLQFTWDGRSYLVEGIGRRWQDAVGAHVLALAQSGDVFELIFQAAERRWFLNRNVRFEKKVLSSWS